MERKWDPERDMDDKAKSLLSKFVPAATSSYTTVAAYASTSVSMPHESIGLTGLSAVHPPLSLSVDGDRDKYNISLQSTPLKMEDAVRQLQCLCL